MLARAKVEREKYLSSASDSGSSYSRIALNDVERKINGILDALGRRLKPFCLKHCLYLEAIGSPVMKLVNGDEVEISRNDLELAVAICSAKGDIIKALERSHIAMKFHSYKRGLTAFLGYLTDFVAVPDVWGSTDSNATINAPWIVAKAMLLLSKTSMTLSDVWNMPLGELLWYCTVFAEQEGVVQIQSDEEKQIIAEVQNGK